MVEYQAAEGRHQYLYQLFIDEEVRGHVIAQLREYFGLIGSILEQLVLQTDKPYQKDTLIEEFFHVVTDVIVLFAYI